MDVEGSERAALIGMSELRRRNPELKLIMEFNRGALQRAGVPPGSLATILVELGFHHGQIIEQGSEVVFRYACVSSEPCHA